MYFIDHWKDLYLSDFRLIESTPGLTHSGTVVIADNCLTPGCPDYVDYVRNKSERVRESEWIETELEYSRGNKKDALCVSYMK
jgi:catechol O-methyltransferase